MSLDPLTPVQSALNRLAAGDAAARDDLLRACRDRVARITRKMLRDFRRVRRWVETDDVVQEALGRLDRAVSTLTFADSRQFFGLAAVKVNHCLLDIARRLFGPEGLVARHHTPGDADLLNQLAEPDSGPAGPFTRWEELHQRAAELPDEMREVFELLWYGGLSQKEAAAHLGVSEKTVKRRWRDAKLALAQALGVDPGL